MRLFASLLLSLAAAAADFPRPEFPQPQFQRDQWMTLNGTWDFELDDSHAGLAANRGAGNRPFSSKVTVPFAPSPLRRN